MGLFGKKKKQEEKDAEQRQWDYVHSPEAKEELRREKAQAASLLEGERTLICGESAFANMSVRGYISDAGDTELYLMPSPDALIEKCARFRPTVIVLTADAEKYPELPERLAREFPEAALILSSSQPETVRCAHALAVMKKPFIREDVLAAMQSVKSGR